MSQSHWLWQNLYVGLWLNIGHLAAHSMEGMIRVVSMVKAENSGGQRPSSPVVTCHLSAIEIVTSYTILPRQQETRVGSETRV